MLPTDNWIRHYLSDGEWHTVREMAERYGIDRIAFRDAMRAMPMFDNGELISHPTKGFRLTKYASDSEVRHTINSLLSRARAIEARAKSLALAHAM